MLEETVAAPAAEPAAAPPPVPAADTTQAAPAEGEQKPAEGADKPPEEKKERHPLEKENARLRRRVENQARRIGELGAHLDGGLQRQPIGGTNGEQKDDSEPLSLTRAEFERLAAERAQQLAPQMAESQAQFERRRAVFERLETEIGVDEFRELAGEMAAAFGGSLTQGEKGPPKPAAEAIFFADNPRALIEYLADTDNAAEAAKLARMGAVEAAVAIAKLDAKLGQRKTPPQPSKAATPIEPIRGGGLVNNAPSDTDSVDTWVKKERARLAALRQPK